MSDIDLTLPDFLKATGPAPSWRGKRPRWTRDMTFREKTKEEDASTRAFKRELEKEQARKKAESLRRLKEWKESQR